MSKIEGLGIKRYIAKLLKLPKFHQPKLKILALLVIFNLSFIIYHLSFISSVFASSEFKVDQQITYDFDQEGNCTTTHTVTLENKLSNIYATQYSFTITGGQIQNINAQNEQGQSLKTDINQSQRNITKLTIFPSPAITGKGKKQTFIIRYFTPEYAKKEGQIWRIIVPKISDMNDIDNLLMLIKAPLGFGKLAFVSPQNYTYRQEEEKQIIQFNQKALAQKEVMAIFGNAQTFQFTLKYYLKNPTDTEKNYSIALPPDTGYQKIYLNQINPQPTNVIADKDGNWLAVFPIPYDKDLEITVDGWAQIAVDPTAPPINPGDLNEYLGSQPYWEINDPQIKQLAQELKTPQKIYQFVTQKLRYDSLRLQKQNIDRLGAKEVLSHPDQAICTEFTDLFVTLMRAAGIPAREINGYAYSNNPQLLPLSLGTDILHSWPEYWDPKKQIWQQVDPTWENTSHIDYFNKLDMTHLVFVIHGQNSQLPLPAGAYRLLGSSGKNVLVSFSSPQIPPPQELQLDFDLPSKLLPRQQVKGYLKISNPGPTALYQQKVKIWGEKVSLNGEINQEVAVLPPFGKKIIPFTIVNKNSVFQEGKAKIFTSLETKSGEKQLKNQEVTLAPIFSHQLIFWGILAVTIILFISLLNIAIKKIRLGSKKNG